MKNSTKLMILLIAVVLMYFIPFYQAKGQIPSDTIIGGTRFTSVFTGDVDSDGDKDMVMNNTYGMIAGQPMDYSIIVAWNNGNNTFTFSNFMSYNPVGQSQLCNSTTHDVNAAADLDGNGFNDIVLNCYNSVGVFYQTSSGVFGPLTLYLIGTATIENFAIDSATKTIALSQWFSQGGTSFFFTLMKFDAGGGYTTSQIATPVYVQDFIFKNNKMFGRSAHSIFEYDLQGTLLNTYPIPVGSTTAYAVALGIISVATDSFDLVGFNIGNSISVKTSTISYPIVQSMYYGDWDGDGLNEHLLMRTNGIEIVSQSSTSFLPNTYTNYIEMHALHVDDLDGDGGNEIVVPLFDINMGNPISGMHIFGGLTVTTNVAPQPIVEPKEEVKLTVFPNPVTNFLTISGAELNDNTEVSVYDAIGRFVKKFHGSILDVSSFKTGTYIIHFMDTNQKIQAVKFVKE